MTTFTTNQLWSIARVAGAMRRALVKRHLPLKALHAAFADGADRKCSALALGLTVVTVDGRTYTDLSDEVIAVVNACLTNRIATTLENLELVRVAYEKSASAQHNAEQWHNVRVANVTRVVNERGLDLTAEEIDAAVVHFENLGDLDSSYETVGINAHINWAILQREIKAVAAAEQWDDWANQHDSRKTEAEMIASDHDEALELDAILEGTATFTIPFMAG